MLENIWRGIQIDYFFIVRHSLQVFFILLTVLFAFLLRILSKIYLQQQQSYTELLDQQQQLEDVQYRLGRINRICTENRDKQRFMSNQLQKVDNSIFELEEAVTKFKEKVSRNNSVPIFEFERE